MILDPRVCYQALRTHDASLEISGESSMTETFYSFYDSPVGRLMLVSDGSHLVGLHTGTRNKPKVSPKEGWILNDDAVPFALAKKQLSAYFKKQLTIFDIPLKMDGTDFQKAVWKELQRIPYGETISYGEQARRMGNPEAVRAVGGANGRNPIAIIVPCHRVIGTDGTLTGYAGGLSRKQFLIALEGGQLSMSPTGAATIHENG